MTVPVTVCVPEGTFVIVPETGCVTLVAPSVTVCEDRVTVPLTGCVTALLSVFNADDALIAAVFVPSVILIGS